MRYVHDGKLYEHEGDTITASKATPIDLARYPAEKPNDFPELTSPVTTLTEEQVKEMITCLPIIKRMKHEYLQGVRFDPDGHTVATDGNRLRTRDWRTTFVPAFIDALTIAAIKKHKAYSVAYSETHLLARNPDTDAIVFSSLREVYYPDWPCVFRNFKPSQVLRISDAARTITDLKGVKEVLTITHEGIKALDVQLSTAARSSTPVHFDVKYFVEFLKMLKADKVNSMACCYETDGPMGADYGDGIRMILMPIRVKEPKQWNSNT